MNIDDRELDSKQHLAQLQTELQHYQQRLAKQRQRNTVLRHEFVQQYGSELLALIDGDARAKVFVTPVVEKLVFQDEQGCVISETDGVPIGQIVEVKLVEPPEQQQS